MRIDPRRTARRLFRRMGFQRTIAPTFVDVMQYHKVDIVLDIGANDGGFAREIRDAGYSGRIVSFEPATEPFARLTAAAAGDPDWEIVKLAVGDTAGKLDLSVSAIDVYSSFKQPSAIGSEAHGARAVAFESVDVVRLDDYLRARPELLSRTYLKIDTQGFEAEVLRGTGDDLSKFAVIQAELGLVTLYQDQDDWLTIVNWMCQRGFEVATMICNSTDSSKARAVEYDVVFTRR